MDANQKTRDIIILAIICGLFVFHSISLEYTQDDAYISYRYVENFLAGHGLVFNIGERVEGYTNFLWIMILSFLSILGLPMILCSKILGVAAGVGTLFIAYLLGREFASERRWYLAFIAPAFLAANGSLAFWVIGGLETGLFIFLTSLIIYSELRRPALTPFLLVVATLTRPEGGLLFGIVFLFRWLIVRENFRKMATYAGIYIGLMIPYAAFKLFYFGDLLPNPFYAKTGASIEYFQSGLEYFARFACHYGLFGLFYILPLFFLRKLPRSVKLYWLTSIVYTIYIIAVGGDVLKVHRFFLPILPFLYLIGAFSITRLVQKIKTPDLKPVVAGILVLAYIVSAIMLPHDFIRHVRFMENALIEKMTDKIRMLKMVDSSNFSLATTTIGKASYDLPGHKVIDMLGLTDPYIAKNPQKIEGMETTWKERNFNAEYLLTMRPDYILFSTGYKPSAPAERALVLNSQFRQNYTTIAFQSQGSYRFQPFWKKTGDFSEPNEVLENTRYVDLIYDFFQPFARRDYETAAAKLDSARTIGPNDFSLVEQLLGMAYMQLRNSEKMMEHYQNALEIDPQCMEVYVNLYLIFNARGDSTRARMMHDKVKELAPWFELN